MNSVFRNTKQSRFELETDGQISVADYRERPDTLVITHIGVPEALRGQGLASQLAQGIIDYARAENLKVQPLCPFMATYFDRHPEFAQLRV
jgi:hypothetical protein